VSATEVAAGKSVIESNSLAEAVGWLEVFEGLSAVKARLVGFADIPVACEVHDVMSVKHSRMPDRKQDFFMVFSSQEYENYSARNFCVPPSKEVLKKLRHLPQSHGVAEKFTLTSLL
jgi:hypothetical protein